MEDCGTAGSSANEHQDRSQSICLVSRGSRTFFPPIWGKTWLHFFRGHLKAATQYLRGASYLALLTLLPRTTGATASKRISTFKTLSLQGQSSSAISCTGWLWHLHAQRFSQADWKSPESSQAMNTGWTEDWRLPEVPSNLSYSTVI